MTRDPLRDQHVVVVGGSSGIGLAVARGAHAVGARDRRTRQAHAVERAFSAIAAPDHLNVSAATFVGGSVLDTPLESLRQAIDIRVWGAVHVVRAAAPRMPCDTGSIALTGGVSTAPPRKGAWPTSVATFTAVAESLPSGRIAHADAVADAVLLLMRNPAINAQVRYADGEQRVS